MLHPLLLGGGCYLPWSTEATAAQGWPRAHQVSTGMALGSWERRSAPLLPSVLDLSVESFEGDMGIEKGWGSSLQQPPQVMLPRHAVPQSAHTHPPRAPDPCGPAHRPAGRPRARPLPGRSLLPPSGCQGQRRWRHRPPQENPAAGGVTRGLLEPTGILDVHSGGPARGQLGAKGHTQLLPWARPLSTLSGE